MAEGWLNAHDKHRFMWLLGKQITKYKLITPHKEGLQMLSSGGQCYKICLTVAI